MKIDLGERESPVVGKIRELCQTILDQPAYLEMRKSIDAFAASAEARTQYNRLCDKQGMLHQKQHHGLEISDEEIADFSREEEAFLRNPLAHDFIEAQQKMQQIEVTVADYVHKTFELGRVPGPQDLSRGCGPSCNCESGTCG